MGLAHFKYLQGLGKSTGKGSFVKVIMGDNNFLISVVTRIERKSF